MFDSEHNVQLAALSPIQQVSIRTHRTQGRLYRLNAFHFSLFYHSALQNFETLFCPILHLIQILRSSVLRCFVGGASLVSLSNDMAHRWGL